jgi:hypothetical protein
LNQGIIRVGKLIWIGNNSALRTRLINAFYSTTLGGHSGVQATYFRLKKLFKWKGLKVDVEDFVKQCKSTNWQNRRELIQQAYSNLCLFLMELGRIYQ